MAAAPQSVSVLFDATARARPDLPFLNVLEETARIYGVPAGEIAYGAAAQRIDALTLAYEQAGYGKGMRVGLLVENRPAYFMHWFALNRLGVSLVPINPDLRAAELEYMIGHSDMVAAVAIPARQQHLREAASAAGRAIPVVGPDDAPARIGPLQPRAHIDAETECALLYTSGTTGRPKGCVLANEYFLVTAEWYARRTGVIAMTYGAERMITPLPLFHMNAMASSTMAMIRHAGCLTVVDRFHPRTWWDSVRASKATVLHYLGVMPAMLMGAPPSADDRMEHVRFGFGAGVDRRLHEPFEKRFGFPLIEAWAMTETGSGAVIVAEHEPRHIGANCFGRPEPYVEISIVGDDGAPAPVDTPGELLVRHAGDKPRYGFFREYLKEPEATAQAWADGWFHTGDVVRQGADGSLYFVDRKKNVIRRSGENIAAVEVESVLLQNPLVAAAAVAPIADDVRGDEVFALIVLRETTPSDKQNGVAAALVEWCLQRLAYYKAPGWIAFVSALPLTGTQKIQRGALKDLVTRCVETGAAIDTRAMKKRSA